jgi:hypothetical protein
LDRNDRQSRSGAKACGGQTGGEAAPIGKPFERITDASAIGRAGADPSDCRRDIECCQRIGDRVERPGDRDEDAADEDDDLRAETVHQPPFDRHQPGLGQDEDRECDLDGGAPPVVL